MKYWFDITNTPQVHFLLSILKGLKDSGEHEFILTTRDFSETVNFLKKKTELTFQVIGGHHGKNKMNKATGLIGRFLTLQRSKLDFDVSISCGSEAAIWNSWLKGKISIAYGDNDLARQWTYGRMVNFAMFPDAIPASILNRQGLSGKKLYQYNGYKEHVYIADYEPDENFDKDLPFKDYVVVRPENIQANYVNGEYGGTITPQLLKLLAEKGLNILYLPRYDFDRSYADGIKNIYIPSGPINGLDACYFSNGVFTGAGTFAREAACLGLPSFSFFAGSKLLAVDKSLIQQDKMFFSRDANMLVSKFLKTNRKPADLHKAKEVKKEVMDKTIKFIQKGI